MTPPAVSLEPFDPQSNTLLIEPLSKDFVGGLLLYVSVNSYGQVRMVSSPNRERSGRVLDFRPRGPRFRASPASLCCGP